MKTIVNKSQFLLLLMTLACTLSTIAQPPGRMKERIKEKKEQVKSQKNCLYHARAKFIT